MGEKYDLKKINWVIKNLEDNLQDVKGGNGFYIFELLYGIRTKIERGISLSKQETSTLSKHLEFYPPMESLDDIE